MTECQCGGQPDGPHTDICYLQGEIERLRAELAECKQDAERFRWLKKVGNYDSAYQYAIDAAMAGGEHG